MRDKPASSLVSDDAWNRMTGGQKEMQIKACHERDLIKDYLVCPDMVTDSEYEMLLPIIDDTIKLIEEKIEAVETEITEERLGV
jgi:SUMO ligase MMS21 Smc5/6 complex component